MSDNEIIQRILEGESNLYRLLVDQYQSMVFRTGIGFLHNKEDAEDLAQEVFVQAYQAISKFKGNSSFSTWLYRITVNAALNKTRKNTKNFVIQRLESVFSTEKSNFYNFSVTDNENPEEIIIGNEHREWVQKALDSLPENQRTAIVLSKYDDLPQKEIAEIMNTTEGAVEALVQRAKANLREKLSSLAKKNSKTSVGKK